MKNETKLLNVYDFRVYSFDPHGRRVSDGTAYEPSRTQISGIGGIERLGVFGPKEAFVALYRQGDRLKLVIGQLEYDATDDELETSMFRWLPGFKRFCVSRAGKPEICAWYSPRVGEAGVDEDDLLETIHQTLAHTSSKREVLAQWTAAPEKFEAQTPRFKTPSQ